MGSFNVACSVSRISIGCGDPVVYIPLATAEYHNKIGDGNNLLIYSHCQYQPVSMPIFGEYDDYGRVGNIRETEVTKRLEEFFKMNIDDIIGIDLMPRPISSGMFVHGDVFAHLVKTQFDEWGKRSGDFVDSPKGLLKDLRESRAECAKELREMAELEMSSLIDYTIDGQMGRFSFRDYPAFKKIFRKMIMDGMLEKEVVEFILFEARMYACNVHYAPAMNGYQCGHKYASRELYKVSGRIVREKIRKQEDE